MKTLLNVTLAALAAALLDGAAKPFSATVNYISPQAEYTPPVIDSRETRAELVLMTEAKFAPAAAAELRPGQPADGRLN